MDKNEVIIILNKFADLVNENMKPSKIVLYGSYANAPHHPPRRIPASSTANVWHVIGIGLQGTNSFIWAISPVKIAIPKARTNL